MTSLDADTLMRHLGVELEPGLLHLALCHRSYCAEVEGEEPNERLEFLGDAVLGLVVTAELYEAHPTLKEGDLARIKAAVVSTEALAPVARELRVGDALLLGNGEEHSGGRDKASLLADAFEALIGAVYLSGGLDSAREFVLRTLEETIEREASRQVLGDAKNTLQELAAHLGAPAPSYRIDERGPDHAKWFSAEVSLGDLVGRGEGRSKKQAERLAAEDALAKAALAGGGGPIDAGAAPSAASSRADAGRPTVPVRDGA